MATDGNKARGGNGPLSARGSGSPELKRLMVRLLVAALYLVLWQLASLAAGSALLLPGPLATLRRFFELMTSASGWARAGMSLLRIACGYVLGVALGTLLAVVSARFRFADALLSPLRGVVKATPVTSFILLALLWLSSGMVPMFASLLMVMPVVWANVLAALRATDRGLIEMAQAFRLSRAKRIKSIYVPSVLPSFLAGCTTALGFAWKAGVAAEVIALPQLSIGYALYMSKLHIETTELFAWTLMIILLSMLLEAILTRLIRRIPHDQSA